MIDAIFASFSGVRKPRMYVIEISKGLVSAIAMGLLTNSLYDLLKSKILKTLKRIEEETPPINKENISLVQIKSGRTEMRIEGENVSKEVFNRALDIFVKVADINYQDENNQILIVVVEGDNVKVLPYHDYIVEYVIPKDQRNEFKKSTDAPKNAKQ
jgi:hypothetical protein